MFFIDVNVFIYFLQYTLNLYGYAYFVLVYIYYYNFRLRPVYKTKKKEKQKGVATYRCTTLSRYNHNTMLNVQDYYGYNNVTLIDRNSKCPKQYII